MAERVVRTMSRLGRLPVHPALPRTRAQPAESRGLRALPKGSMGPTHQERFEPIDVTLPWLDPEAPDLVREDRRKVTVPLLVHTGRRGAINRTTWNTKAWKPALADVGVIPPLPERQPGEKPSRVWRRWLRPDLAGGCRKASGLRRLLSRSC